MGSVSADRERSIMLTTALCGDTQDVHAGVPYAHAVVCNMLQARVLLDSGSPTQTVLTFLCSTIICFMVFFEVCFSILDIVVMA